MLSIIVEFLCSKNYFEFVISWTVRQYNLEVMSLAKSDKSIEVKYDGATEILCGEHDYKKFPGLEEDLANYANNWKGSGWGDIKVNVKDAEGTAIVVHQPIVKPLGDSHNESVVIVEDKVRNDSSEPINSSIQLKGTFTNSLSSTVESEMSREVAAEIGGAVEIYSASVSTKVSATAKKGQTETSSETTEYTRIVNFTLPPKKGFMVKMIAEVEKRKISVTLPSKIQGKFRIQYPSKRDGAYYWISYISAAQQHNHDESNMVIIVDNGKAIDVKTVIQDLPEESQHTTSGTVSSTCLVW